MYKYVYMYVHTYIYTHIHTHTHAHEYQYEAASMRLAFESSGSDRGSDFFVTTVAPILP